MSRLMRDLAIARCILLRDEEEAFEMSEMREEIGLRWHIQPGNEQMGIEELGAHVDDRLVEYISDHLLALEEKAIGIEEFKATMNKIEEGMREDPALKAFTVTLWRNDELPPASTTYLYLARRRALYGGKPPPSFDEGSQFARVLLAGDMDPDSWENDVTIGWLSRDMAGRWLSSRDSDQLQDLVRGSEEYPFIWDALKLICKELADGGEEDLPYALLKWFFEAADGRLERPKERPAPEAADGRLERPKERSAPSNRPNKWGYKLRNEHIRHTVELLSQVGMPETGGADSGCYVVASEMHLSVTYIENLCMTPAQKPALTLADFIEDGLERFSKKTST